LAERRAAGEETEFSTAEALGKLQLEHHHPAPEPSCRSRRATASAWDTIAARTVASSRTSSPNVPSSP